MNIEQYSWMEKFPSFVPDNTIGYCPRCLSAGVFGFIKNNTHKLYMKNVIKYNEVTQKYHCNKCMRLK